MDITIIFFNQIVQILEFVFCWKASNTVREGFYPLDESAVNSGLIINTEIKRYIFTLPTCEEDENLVSIRCFRFEIV